MKTILKALLCLLFLAILFSCAQEEIGRELMISGKFAQINESGLTNLIVEFNDGQFTRWESDESYPFAEKRIWHCSSQDFRKTTTSPYSIIDGVLYSGYANLGSIELADDVLHFNGDTFGVMEGFIPSAYSRITVNPEEIINLTYAAESVRVPVHIENPIPGGVLSATTTAKWISNLRVEDGYLLFNTASTKENRDAVIILSYTHADILDLTVAQAPSTFIRITDPDKTIGYETSSYSIEYTIDNPIASSVLTVNCSNNWIQNLEIQDGRVNFNVTENNTGNERKAYFYFQYEGAPDVMITLTQKWDAATITTSPESAEFEYTGGQGNFTFEIQNPRQGTTVTAQSQVNWISNVLVNGNTVTYRVAENNSVAQRSGKIKLGYGSYATVEYPVAQKGKTVVSLTLNKNSLSLIVGKSETLIATVDPSDATLIWASDNTSVATVSQAGKVIANGNGIAIISVSADNGIIASCVVTVTTPVASINFNNTSISLYVGEELPIIATVLPDNASNKSLNWTSSNESVATVDPAGKVMAVSKGTATIKAKAQDGSGKYASCSLTVKNTAVIPEAVDLGIVVNGKNIKWGSLNLGATRPEEYGDYYAWAETEPKDNYNRSTYKWSEAENSLTKYNTGGSGMLGIVDNMTEFADYGYEDDAARATLGGKWRTPTDAEWTALRTQCTWTWTTQNGVNGCLVTASNGSSIFLPAAGFWIDTRLAYAGSDGYYWSSSLARPCINAYSLCFDSDKIGRYTLSRYLGQSIRPVSE